MLANQSASSLATLLSWAAYGISGRSVKRGSPRKKHECVCSVASVAFNSTTLWAVAHQAVLSMGFSRQEHWSGLSCLPPEDLPYSETEALCLISPALAGEFFTTEPSWKPRENHACSFLSCKFSSVQFSHSVMSNSLQPHESQHARPPCPSPTLGVHSNFHPLSW